MLTKKFVTALALSSSLVHAADIYTAVVRDQEMNLSTETISEEKLYLKPDSKDLFARFNIVKGTSETQVPLRDLSEAERLRVVTLNYHLNIARDYFEKKLKSNYITTLGPITVRYDMAKLFSTSRHFTEEDSKFNNAVTNKPSNKYKSEDVAPWGIEIWFRPGVVKEEKMPKGALLRSLDTNMADELLMLGDSAINEVAKRAALGYDIKSYDSNHLAFQFGLIFLLKKVFPHVLDYSFSHIPMDYKLDTAMLPEIIYHEYAHVAMSDTNPLTSSYVATEGMANYFASVILGRPSIGMKGAEYVKNTKGYEFDKKLKYKSAYDHDSKLAHNSFTLSYLWKIRETIQQEYQSAELFDQIVFESRKYTDIALYEKERQKPKEEQKEIPLDRSIIYFMPHALKQATDNIVTNDPALKRGIRLIIAKTAEEMKM